MATLVRYGSTVGKASSFPDVRGRRDRERIFDKL